MKIKNIFTLLLFFFTAFSFSQNDVAGREFVKLLFTKNYLKCFTYIDDSIKNEVTADQLSMVVQQMESELGNYKKITDVTKAGELVYYTTEFEKGTIDVQVAFSSNSKVIGFYFVPRQARNEQQDITSFTIKSSNGDLKGTLLIPDAQEVNKKRLVIFLAGSGPQDRDETIYGNKPLRDIAEGLKKNGISSYRFDKNTLTNPGNFTIKSTIDDEYVNDAITALNYFKDSPDYKDYKIIFIGHSLGGHILPRVYHHGKGIAKLVLLAANARPLDELIVDQYLYLSALYPENTDLSEESKKAKKLAVVLRSKEFSERTSPQDILLGQSFYYWKSLTDYSPIQDVKTINIPIMVLQGEKDYQVTMKDFILWKSAIKSKGSEFISYPQLNHLFMQSIGLPNPEEYEKTGSVDDKVIQDISRFISQ